MKTIDSAVNVGWVKFTFTDEDGEVFASFKIKPTDPRILERCKNVAGVFQDLSNVASGKTAVEVENIVEEKFCELLGYDCRSSLFGQVAATDTIDGKLFLNHILAAMLREIGPYVRQRRAANIARHTGKYKK